MIQAISLIRLLRGPQPPIATTRAIALRPERAIRLITQPTT